ncbi:MAG: hypothetical protein ACXWJM_02435 [Ramlibacter sp.]
MVTPPVGQPVDQLSAAETIVGPVDGYSIALYAVAQPDGGFVGYYKICSDTPSNCWESACLLKGSVPDAYDDVAAALQRAETYAMWHISNMPEPASLAAYRERRYMSCFERRAMHQTWGERVRSGMHAVR